MKLVRLGRMFHMPEFVETVRRWLDIREMRHIREMRRRGEPPRFSVGWTAEKPAGHMTSPDPDTSEDAYSESRRILSEQDFAPRPRAGGSNSKSSA